MTGPSFYNTLTRTIEPLTPIHPGHIGIYACGPTVYWFAHIGNMRAYVFVDVLRRTLKAQGLDVKLVMNITDVGHLTDDASEGEDKMMVAMRREGKTAYEIARVYEDAFVRDLKQLHIGLPDVMPRATDHIQEQIDMILALEEKGYTYRTQDGIYFDTAKLADYCRLSGQKAEEKLAGARIELGEKHNITDFALWKFAKEGVKREMEWESPWGVGFPGWHIECSAMSKKYLGVPFDIHTGGIDHIAVHHENELAQVKGAEGVLEANMWLHSEFLTVDGGKMSKSLGNVYTISDLVEKGFDPLAYRYFCLGAQYRSKLNFTWEALTAAQNALKHLRAFVRTLPAPSGMDVQEIEHVQAFDADMRNDLDTPKALSCVWAVIESDLPAETKATALAHMDAVLGLGLEAYMGIPLAIPSEVQKLVEARKQARDAKNWQESDRLRDAVLALGFVVEDTPSGQHVREA